MKKSTKLLSVILAIIMIFSSVSVMASAYQTYNDSQEAVYDTNDKGLAFLLTDEQRASWLCDLLNGLLRSANIYQEVAVIGTVDLTSLDAVFATINNLSGWLGAANVFNVDLGLLNKLNIDVIKNNKGISVNSTNGATRMITALLDFLNQNINAIVDEVIPGGISLGVINLGDLSAVNNILGDLDGFIEKTVYGLGMRKITNGIGNDPEWPNSAEWTSEMMPLDTIVQNILVKVLTEPNHTRKATVPADNEIITNPTAFGATAAMIHTEAATDGSGDTWYYIYGTQNNKGEWEFTETSAKLDGVSDKNYILTWDENSSLVKNFDTSVFNFTSKPLYEMLGEVLPWAYETFGATNLDGQLRATLMQFAGAFNDSTKVDEATKATLQAKLEAKKAIQDNGTKAALGDAFDAETGAAGNYNFAYFSLSGADINTMPDDLYYVVEWDGNWEFYKVDFTGVTGEKLAMFNTINWEYQTPGTYAELMPAGFNAGKTSSLRNITDAIGKILATAIKDLDWTYDNPSEDNAHFEANLMKLVRKYIKLAPELIFGVDDAYKATPEKIDAMTDEQVVVLIGADVMTWLMPALVLPEDVSCLEELLVYGVREFITEIMPEHSWDDKIAAAKTDADFLNIALDMGTSIGVYYLKNVMALGTKTDGNGNTTTDKLDAYLAPSADCATGWNTKLNYIVDQILTLWVPDLTADLKADNATAFSGTNGLLKLTAVFNTLFPGLLSLISGCNGNGYACDLAVVKDLIAGILDLKIEPIAAKLYRNDTGYANKALYNALVNIVLDLLNGLGASNSNDYAGLVSTANTALEATNPLDTLVQDANIKPFIKALLWVLVDGDTSGVPINVRNIWVQDVLAILMQVTGQMDDMSLSGMTQTLDKQKYIGTTSPVITPSVTLDTTGLKSVWYDGGYRTGTFHQDGAYSGLLTKYEICDLQGNVIATKDNINVKLNPNETYSGTSITGVASSDTKAYTLKSYVIVTLPDGKTEANNGEPIVTVSSFMTSAAANDDSVNPITLLNNKTDTTVKMWNIYLDEFTPLAQIAQFNMTVSCSASHTHKMWINGYGWLTDNNDGSYTFKADKADAFTWGYRTSNGDDLTLQAGDSRTVFYWAWNNDHSGTEFSSSSQISSRQWYVDTKNFTRDQYPADFTSFAFNTTNIQVYWKKNIFQSGTDTHQAAATPYIIFYNSYGLEQQIASALNANRVKDDYTAASWNTYINALEAAIAEFYMAKTAATFMDDHMTNGVSDFKTASENLKAAIEGLEAKVASAGSASNDYTAEEKAVLANLKTTLDTQADKHLDNKDYIMYRWLKYHNEYTYLWNVYNGSMIPSGVASDKLAGVPSDNDKIAEVIAAADANKQAAITAMKEPASQAEQDAAEKAKADFTANLPKLDTTAIQVDSAQMAQYEQRLISKSSYTQYLTAALTLVSGAQQADYTAESWAKFADAKAAAQAITASNKPSEIHKARYNLLVAYKGLLPAGTDVDLTALQEKMNFVEAIFANPTLFQPSAAAIEAGYDTLDKAMAEVLKEAGAKVTVGEDTYYVGGNDTGAAWLDEAGMRTANEAQATVDRVTNEITNALAYVESAIKIVPDDTVADNTTEVGQNLIIDGLKPGTINSSAELLNLVTTTVPSGYTADLAVTASAAVGFGTGTKVVLTVAEVPGLVFTHTVMVYGDVNGDGAIDAFDAALIDLHIAGAQLTGDFALAADASADADITVADYAAVENCAVGAATINQARA